MTEIFNELALIGEPMSAQHKVFYLLTSLSTSFDVLVAALEGNTEISTYEVVAEKHFHEERNQSINSNGTTGNSFKKSSEIALVSKSHDKETRKCYKCGKDGHLKTNSWRNKDNKGNFKKHQANQVEIDGEELFIYHSLLTKCDATRIDWIIDSGASCQVRDLVNPQLVYFGDGHSVEATSVGNVKLNFLLEKRKIVCLLMLF